MILFVYICLFDCSMSLSSSSSDNYNWNEITSCFSFSIISAACYNKFHASADNSIFPHPLKSRATMVSMRSKVRISDRFVNEKLLSVIACRLLMANAVYSELMKNFSHFHENKFLWLGKVFATFARSEMSALKTKK